MTKVARSKWQDGNDPNRALNKEIKIKKNKKSFSNCPSVRI